MDYTTIGHTEALRKLRAFTMPFDGNLWRYLYDNRDNGSKDVHLY